MKKPAKDTPTNKQLTVAIHTQRNIASPLLIDGTILHNMITHAGLEEGKLRTQL